MRKYYLYVLMCMFSTLGFSQQSNTMGNIVGWPFATITVTLQNPSGQTPINIMNGQTVATKVVGMTNSAGNFTITVDRNDLIVPNGTRWLYHACSMDGTCFDSQPVYVVSAPQTITLVPPILSLEGTKVVITNGASNLRKPTAMEGYGRMAIVGNSLWVFDLTTMNWIASPVTLTQAGVVSAIAGAAIAPASIVVSGTSTFGAITNGKGIQVATGTVGVINAGITSTISVSLPITETNNLYSVTGCSYNGSNVTYVAITLSAFTTTSFSASITNLGLPPTVASTITCLVIHN